MKLRAQDLSEGGESNKDVLGLSGVESVMLLELIVGESLYKGGTLKDSLWHLNSRNKRSVLSIGKL